MLSMAVTRIMPLYRKRQSTEIMADLSSKQKSQEFFLSTLFALASSMNRKRKWRGYISYSNGSDFVEVCLLQLIWIYSLSFKYITKYGAKVS